MKIFALSSSLFWAPTSWSFVSFFFLDTIHLFSLFSFFFSSMPLLHFATLSRNSFFRNISSLDTSSSCLKAAITPCLNSSSACSHSSSCRIRSLLCISFSVGSKSLTSSSGSVPLPYDIYSLTKSTTSKSRSSRLPTSLKIPCLFFCLSNSRIFSYSPSFLLLRVTFDFLFSNNDHSFFAFSLAHCKRSCRLKLLFTFCILFSLCSALFFAFSVWNDCVASVDDVFTNLSSSNTSSNTNSLLLDACS
mmetsp:Transcript_5665/g.8312  ORF Transcript_5665/g.8312 Transcript_5665/m.8312 type:complete len:247 (+) Transcript_5665:1420-2160(+)